MDLEENSDAHQVRNAFCVIAAMVVGVFLCIWLASIVSRTQEDSLPGDEQAEIISDSEHPVVSGAAPDKHGHYADPHDDPRWHHTRTQEAKAHPFCVVNGCEKTAKKISKGNAIHHGVSAKWCVAAGFYELAVENGPGQKFYTLCEEHHGPIGHGIGHGGSWDKFNPDIEHDVESGKFNSRGKSQWFTGDKEAVLWVHEKVRKETELARPSKASTSYQSKTVIAP